MSQLSQNLTDREKEFLKFQKDRGVDASTAFAKLQEARDKGKFWEAEPVAQTSVIEKTETEKVETPKEAGLIWRIFARWTQAFKEWKWPLEWLETGVSETITDFGKQAQAAAESETVQATWEEIPFTEKSKILKNIKPSFEKAVWGLAETVGSPIDSAVNLWKVLKATTMKWMESWLLGTFIKSSEWDKVIQEALTWEMAKFKEKVNEKGFVKTVNEAMQEDPLVWITLLTSWMKKIWRAGGLSEKQINKIDTLEKEAKQNIQEFLDPTKAVTKQKTKEITPQIMEKIRTWKLTPEDREIIKEKVEADIENVGNKIGDFIAEWKVKWEIQLDKLVEVLANEDKKLRIDWVLAPQNAPASKFINSQLDFLQQLESKYGTNIPTDKQVELRQLYDVVFDKTITRDKITKFQDDLQVKLADALREELAKNNPDLAKLNKEYTFAKGMDFVLEETLERRTGRPEQWLIDIVIWGQQGTAWAVIWATVWWQIWWTLWAGVWAMFWGAIWAKIRSITSSPKYKLVTAKKKLELADAIARGDIGKVEKIADSIIISTWISALPEDEQ